MYSVHVYSGTSPYGHLTSKVTSSLRSPLLSPELYSEANAETCLPVFTTGDLAQWQVFFMKTGSMTG